MTKELLDLPLEQHPAATVRPEPFGALAYQANTRRLSMLKSTQLATIVEHLADHDTVRDALVAAGVGVDDHAHFGRALERLLASEVIRVRAD